MDVSTVPKVIALTRLLRSFRAAIVLAVAVCGCGEGAELPDAQSAVGDAAQSAAAEQSPLRADSTTTKANAGVGADKVSPSSQSSPLSEMISRAATSEAPSAEVADPAPMSTDAEVAKHNRNDVGSGVVSGVRLRLPDDRPDVNAERLRECGIRRYDGRRLVLLSDVPADQLQDLTELTDLLFEHLQRHFGPLPDAVDGTDFQVTGHIIEKAERFQAAGLMPGDGLSFTHGRHLNDRFWMYSPPEAYYRRHLALHEFVHCYMTCECGMNNLPPGWYFEGMADYFATHRMHRAQDGTLSAEFGIMPDQTTGFEGWGRISELQRAFSLQRSLLTDDSQPRFYGIPSLGDILTPEPSAELRDLNYTRAWAACWFLNSHPLLKPAARQLRNLRTYREINDCCSGQVLHQPGSAADITWLLFMESLCEGFDPQTCTATPAARVVSPQAIAASRDGITVRVAAKADWQDSGLRLSTGDIVELTADGRFTVNTVPSPWVSEPQGISAEYYKGLPVGMLVAVFVSTDGAKVTERIAVGRYRQLTAPCDGSLWLQLNDSAADRRNNDGQVTVTISAQSNE